MILSPDEGTHHSHRHILGELRVAAHQSTEIAAPVSDNDAVAHCLGAETILITGLNAEDVAT